MFLLAWIRKLYKVLSADTAPAAVAFAVAFGITLACVPLSSGLGILLLASILILRVQVSAALLALACAKVLVVAGLGRLFVPVGAALLEGEALRGFWTTFLNLPLVAWLDLDHVAITGGAVVGFLVGGILFWPIMNLVIAYRRFLHDKLSENKFFKWMTSFFVVKALRFVFVGPR